MNDLKTLIVTVLAADTALRALLGVRSGDPRVYPYYQPSATINNEQRAYVTFALTADPERTAAVTQPTFTLAIWAISWDVASQVRDRIVAIFDFTARPGDTLTTGAGRVVQPVKIAEHDSAQENTQFRGITLTFRLGGSAV